MKKLFPFVLVVFLLLAAVNLIGCNGLWGFDDDDDVVGPVGAKFSFKGNVDLPGDGKGTLNLRGAVASLNDDLYAVAYKMTLVGGVATETAVSGEAAVNSDGDYQIDFTGDPAFFVVKIKSKKAGLESFKMLVVLGEVSASKPTQTANVNSETTAVALIIQKSGQLLAPDAIDPIDVASSKTLVETALKPGGDGKIEELSINILVRTIELNKAKMALSQGSSETLVAVASPSYATNKTLKWESSNTAIAEVDNTGKVTAKDLGNATITVSATDGGGAAPVTCEITVSAVAVGSVSISPAELSLALNGTTSGQLTATVLPANASDKTVAWKSLNTTVANVDAQGNVTAVGVGETTITATAGGIEARNIVKVTILLKDISIAPTGATIGVNATTKPVVTFDPADAVNKKVTWTSDNTGVATVNAEGLITGAGLGTANIKVKSEDGGFEKVFVVEVVSGSSVTVDPAVTNRTVGELQIHLVGAPTSLTSVTTSLAATGVKDANGAAVATVVWKVTSVSAGYPVLTPDIPSNLADPILVASNALKSVNDFTKLTFSEILPSNTVVKVYSKEEGGFIAVQK